MELYDMNSTNVVCSEPPGRKNKVSAYNSGTDPDFNTFYHHTPTLYITCA